VLSFLKKFSKGLSKTLAGISSKTHGLFGGRPIDASSIEALREALYGADFGGPTTEEILEEVGRAARKEKGLDGRRVPEIGAEVLVRVLAGSEGKVTAAAAPPTVIFLVGVNGSGKTTTAAKLAHRLKQQGGSVLLAACDTFRAAAIDQLRSWALRWRWSPTSPAPTPRRSPSTPCRRRAAGARTGSSSTRRAGSTPRAT
jgi:fused signal recognition particle receptor